ncbi:MAG: flippase-like domain-containing protein [Polyangiaceae bacterium]|nr:flippase-like domain-containing protein [Polyangiaceae bacterium]
MPDAPGGRPEPEPRAAAPRALGLAGVVVGVVASGGLLALALRSLEPGDVVAAWRSSTPWPWIPLAVAAYLAGHLVRGQRCRTLVRAHAPLGLVAASNVVVLGYASNNVLPARLGELVRAGVLAERTGMPVTQALTVTLLERLLDALAVLAFLVLAMTRLPPDPWTLEIARVAGVGLGVAGAALATAALAPGLVIASVARATAGLGANTQTRAVRLTAGVVDAVVTLREPSVLAPVLGTSLLVWALETAMFVLLLPAFGLAADPWRGAAVMSVANLGILVPSTPGYVGTFHWFCANALGAQGVDAPTALAYAVVAHLSFFVPVTAWGAVALLGHGVRVGRAVALARSARRPGPGGEVAGWAYRRVALRAAPGAAEPPPPPPFLRALAEALVDGTGAPPEPAALDRAARFAALQLRALPPALRAAHAAGLAGFRAWITVRHGRSFHRLAVPARRRAVDAWAFGPIAPLRQLLRPLRSLLLLGYFESVASAERGGRAPREAAP